MCASQHDWTRAVHAGTAPHFELNYGASSKVMLHVIAPLNYSRPRGGGVRYGPGDVELGFIYRFVEENDGKPSIGTFPHLELPAGSRSRGLGNGRPQLFLPIWVFKTWGKWATYGGGGYWINPGPGNKNNWAYGGVVQRELSKAVTIGAEIFGNSASAIGESGRLGFNIGAILTLSDEHGFMFSAGRDIHGEDDFYLYVCYHILFGSHD